jgi:6-phosphogluconolactonase (cycloisomerase 2 family)
MALVRCQGVIFTFLFGVLGCTGCTKASLLGRAGNTLIPNPVSTSPLTGSTQYFVYASTDISGNHALVGFRLDPNSATVTLVQGAGSIAPTAMRGLTVTSDGRYLYGIDSSAHLNAFQIDPQTGAISAARTAAYMIPNQAENIRSYKVGDREFVYVSLPWLDQIAAFEVNATNGDLTAVPGSPFATVGLASAGGICTPFDFTMSQNAKFLYASCENQGNDNNEGVAGFSVNADGSLTALPSSPWAGVSGSQIYGIAASPDSKFLYGFGVFGPMDLWTISADGSLTYGTNAPYRYSSFSQMFRGLVDPSGLFITLLHPDIGGGSEALGVVARDPVTGEPGATVTSTPVANGTWGNIDMDVDGKFVVAASADLHIYSRDSTTGALTELASSPWVGMSINGGVVITKSQD